MKKEILKLALPKKDNIHTYFLTGDWHDFYLCQNTFKILLQTAKKLKRENRRIIINGDFLDCGEFMQRSDEFKAWFRDKNGMDNFFMPAIEKAKAWALMIFDKLETVFPRENIIIGEGNHEYRLNDFRKKCAIQYRKFFDLKEIYELKERKYKFYKYNHWVDIGSISITHGMYHGSTCIKRHYEAAGRSVVFSHVHQVESKSFVRRGETVMSQSLPCMCNLSPAYLKDSENNWTKGFGILNVKSNGNYNYNVFTVWDNELILPFGERIKP